MTVGETVVQPKYVRLEDNMLRVQKDIPNTPIKCSISELWFDKIL